MCVAISIVSGTPSALDDVEDHLAAGGGRLVEPVERAVHAVAGVVVDVDDEASLEPGDAGARQVACTPSRSRASASASSTVGARSRCGPCRGSPCSARARGSALTMRTSLPSASSAKAIASCEPIESPSGRACEVIRKRWRARIASRDLLDGLASCRRSSRSLDHSSSSASSEARRRSAGVARARVA